MVHQWSISGPSPSKILGFYGSRQLQGGTAAYSCEGVFGTSQSSCWTQVFVVARVSAHLEIYICMPRLCIHTYVCSYHGNQKQHGCDESATTSLTMPSRLSGFSCLIHTTTLCEAACEKRLAEWKRDHARNPMDHRSSRVRRITTTSKGAVAPFVVKAAVHHCHRKLSFALRGMTEISGSFVMTLRGTSKRQVIVASPSLLTLVLARLRY